MSRGAQAGAVVLAALAGGGILATAALGTSCDDAVEWDGARYVSVGDVNGAVEQGPSLGEGEIPDCEAGGRCAPPGEAVEVFGIEGVDPDVAVAAGEGVYLAPGTFPVLPDHPLHEAVYGASPPPSQRAGCGEPFTFRATVTQSGGGRRVEPEAPLPEQVVADEGQVWVAVDAGSVLAGFDRDGVATLEVGAPVRITAQPCEGDGELAGPVADRIEPASAG